MPQELILHERHTLTFHRIGDNAARLSAFERQVQKGVDKLLMIMSIDLLDAPAEGFPLSAEGLEIEDVANISQALDFVIVDDRHKIVQLVMGCEKCCFPNRAFVTFPVTQHGE